MSECVFGSVYSGVYDTLYQNKDYEVECDFLQQIFGNHAQSPIHTILDLGCGTGGHALPLMKRGYTIAGVDRSSAMLSEARRKCQPMCEFILGDICDIDLSHTFDAVIAMFAVISYQTTNENLAAAFRTARRHLEPGGLFVFDCWYGPAVLVQGPASRYKVIGQGNERIIRYTDSVLDTLRHTVQVNYKVLCLEGDRVLNETDESHLMRYLFPQEIRYYLNEANFELLRLCPFMRLNMAATKYDWNVTVVGRAV